MVESLPVFSRRMRELVDRHGHTELTFVELERALKPWVEDDVTNIALAQQGKEQVTMATLLAHVEKQSGCTFTATDRRTFKVERKAA